LFYFYISVYFSYCDAKKQKSQVYKQFFEHNCADNGCIGCTERSELAIVICRFWNFNN